MAHQFPQIIDRMDIEDLQEELLLYRNSQELLPMPSLRRDDPLSYRFQVSKLSHFPLLTQLVKGVLCIPHGNADVERLFSLMNNVKTSIRNQLGNDTVTALLVIKNNNGDDVCYNFQPTKEMISKTKSATYQHLQKSGASKRSADVPATSKVPTAETVPSSNSKAPGLESSETSISKVTTTTLSDTKRKRKSPKTLEDYMCL